MTKATEDQLSELHSEFARQLRDILKNEPSAAHLSVIRQFLKDNEITSDIGSNPDMAELAKAMPKVSDLDNMVIGSGPFN